MLEHKCCHCNKMFQCNKNTGKICGCSWLSGKQNAQDAGIVRSAPLN